MPFSAKWHYADILGIEFHINSSRNMAFTAKDSRTPLSKVRLSTGKLSRNLHLFGRLL